MKQNSTYL